MTTYFILEHTILDRIVYLESFTTKVLILPKKEKYSYQYRRHNCQKKIKCIPFIAGFYNVVSHLS